MYRFLLQQILTVFLVLSIGKLNTFGLVLETVVIG